jgi:hypothetical protein
MSVSTDDPTDSVTRDCLQIRVHGDVFVGGFHASTNLLAMCVRS